MEGLCVPWAQRCVVQRHPHSTRSMVYCAWGGESEENIYLDLSSPSFLVNKLAANMVAVWRGRRFYFVCSGWRTIRRWSPYKALHTLGIENTMSNQIKSNQKQSNRVVVAWVKACCLGCKYHTLVYITLGCRWLCVSRMVWPSSINLLFIRSPTTGAPCDGTPGGLCSSKSTIAASIWSSSLSSLLKLKAHTDWFLHFLWVEEALALRHRPLPTPPNSSDDIYSEPIF